MKQFVLILLTSFLLPLTAMAQSTEKAYDVVEQMPEYPGGIPALIQFLQENLQYPELAMASRIEGRVLVAFIVEKDGSISDIHTVRSVDPSLDKEAIRVVSIMPKWAPGYMNGKPVRVRFTLPINFKLPTEEE